MKVFISYTHKDQAIAKLPGKWLREEGLDVWVADNEVFPSDNWAEKIGQALNESEAMVAVLTPNAIHSDHVVQDIQFALGSSNYSQRLIPLLVGSPSVISVEAVAWILGQLHPIRIDDITEIPQAAKRISEALLASV